MKISEILLLLQLESNESNIIEQIKRGNSSVFKDVYRLYYSPLCRFANKYFSDEDDVEDIVQETFVSIWENRETNKINNIRTYLFTAVKNACLNKLKHLKIVDKYIDSTSAELMKLELENDETYLDSNVDELTKKVEDILEILPEQRKKIMKLRYIDGLNSKEIAALTNTSQRTVETHIYKAIKTLQKSLNGTILTIIYLLTHIF